MFSKSTVATEPFSSKLFVASLSDHVLCNSFDTHCSVVTEDLETTGGANVVDPTSEVEHPTGTKDGEGDSGIETSSSVGPSIAIVEKESSKGKDKRQ